MPEKIVHVPRKIFKAHPVFGWTLTPGKQVRVNFRDNLVQHIDAQGNRSTPNVHSECIERMKLAVYGCSFTYGTALADTETYSALLQKAYPNLHIANKGVGGYSTVQALLRFREDIKNEQVDIAIFGVISDHRYRNLPHPYRMKSYLRPVWHQLGIEQVPHARFDRKGNIEIVFTPIWQPVIAENNISVFLPDEHVIDLITIGVFREILKLAESANIPVVFALLDQLDPHFNTLMTDTFAQSHDASTPYNSTYNFLPDDIHPNALANQCFAQRLRPILDKILSGEGNQ